MMSSGSLNDGKAAIPLLKGIKNHLPAIQLRFDMMDAGYDYDAIYKQVHRMKGCSIIAYKRMNQKQSALTRISLQPV